MTGVDSGARGVYHSHIRTLTTAVDVAVPTFELRVQHVAASESVVYQAFDADDQILYVGLTDHFHGRMGQHSLESPWWAKAATIRVEVYQSRQEAADREKLLIRRFLPPYNTVHAKGYTAPWKSLQMCENCPTEPHAEIYEDRFLCHDCYTAVRIEEMAS